MDDPAFDQTLIDAAFTVAALSGWEQVSVAAAARAADLPLERARARFAGRDSILMRFGRLADRLALTDALAEGTAREKLFDILMRRFDALQARRAGMLALLRALPANPALALGLAVATAHSMAWMLEGAGISSTGLRGALRAKGLTAVWFYALRAWQHDDSEDLSATMAAVDRALERAEQANAWLESRRDGGPKPFPENPAGDVAGAEAAA
jgi:hypothetical protein